MRPLMDLVRQRAEPAEGEAEHRGRRAPCAIEWNRVQHQEDGNRDRRDLSVGINEAAAEEIIGVDVMHAERNQQARADEASTIHRLIHAHFDARAEHLPSLEEVAAAVADGTVLIAPAEGAIGALLFHSGSAVTTTLRYWLVLPEFRGMGYGYRLLERYFSGSASCRRFLLWVQRDNARAIAQYERAGYRPDGLIDQILRRPN